MAKNKALEAIQARKEAGEDLSGFDKEDLLEENRRLKENGVILFLPIDQIVIEENERKTFNEESLKELAASILEKGLLQPIHVRADKGRYVLVAGERRLRAHILAGLKEIKSIIHYSIKSDDVSELQLIENLLREDMTPEDTENSFYKLYLKYDRNVSLASKAIGKSKGWGSQLLKSYSERQALLTTVPSELKEVVKDLSRQAILSLSKVDKPDEKIAILTEASKDEPLTARSIAEKSSTPTKEKTKSIQDLIEEPAPTPKNPQEETRAIQEVLGDSATDFLSQDEEMDFPPEKEPFDLNAEGTLVLTVTLSKGKLTSSHELHGQFPQNIKEKLLYILEAEFND